METKNTFKIAVASGKGGVGKSMFSSGLSFFFAKERKITAADCDADAPNLNIWLGKQISNKDKVIPISVSSLPKIDYKKCDNCGICLEKCRFEAVRIENNKVKINPFLCEGCGLCQFVCPQKAIKLKPVQSGEIRILKIKENLGEPYQKFFLVSGYLFPGQSGSGKIVDEIKNEAEKIKSEIMIIDSAPGTGCPVTASLRGTNFVVLITEPTLSGLSDLNRVLEVVNHFNLNWGLVINKWDINKDLSRKMENKFKNKMLGKISYDKKIFESISNLIPIVKTNLKAKKEIEKIYEKIKKRIQSTIFNL